MLRVASWLTGSSETDVRTAWESESAGTRGVTRFGDGMTSDATTTALLVGALPGETPHVPARSASRQPRVVHGVAAPFRAPGAAGDRFQLVGRYHEAHDTLHLFYSDGLFSVSVFEQKGDLDPTGLPAGAEPRTVDGRDVRQYRTPGGVVIVWQSDDVVYTTVSDAPVDQIDHVLADFGPSPSPNALDRVTNFVLGPFSW